MIEETIITEIGIIEIEIIEEHTGEIIIIMIETGDLIIEIREDILEVHHLLLQTLPHLHHLHIPHIHQVHHLIKAQAAQTLQ